MTRNESSLTTSDTKSVQVINAADNLQAKQENSSSQDLFQRVNQQDVCRLTRQLAILLRSGMPLLFALEALEEQFREGTQQRHNWKSRKEEHLADIMEDIAVSVDSGSSLADSLDRHSEIFPDFYIGMVAAGEESGNL